MLRVSTFQVETSCVYKLDDQANKEERRSQFYSSFLGINHASAPMSNATRSLLLFSFDSIRFSSLLLSHSDSPLLLSLVGPSYFSFHLRPYRVKGMENTTPSLVLGVFGLSQQTDEAELNKIFSQYGQVEKATVIYDKQVSQSNHPQRLRRTTNS